MMRTDLGIARAKGQWRGRYLSAVRRTLAEWHQRIIAYERPPGWVRFSAPAVGRAGAGSFLTKQTNRS
jgi:hypothetical protein